MYIKYKDRYKYVLWEDYRVMIPIYPPATLITDFITLTTEGELTISKWYAWDGPSGPTIDTKNFMRGSIVHDALYQLMREMLLNSEEHRDVADKILMTICLEDGMSWIRAWWVYWGVRLGGGPYADPAFDHPVITAP